MIEQMKKYFSIFFAALLAVACVEPLQPYLGPIVNKPDEEAKVTVEFSLPPMTKGDWGHNPSISTIHVAVFNEAGVLKQYEKATLMNESPNNNLNGINANNPTYSVDINMSATKRILHFIADSPVDSFDDLVALAGTSGEDVILNALTTTDGKAAYWQRFELDKIDAYTYNGDSYTPPGATTPYTGSSYTYQYQGQTITVYEGDFIKRDGSKVLDGTGYFASDYVSSVLANIPFIRNFAEITVSRDEEHGYNFTPIRFALMNVPKKGYVAPFDTKKDQFVEAYMGANVENITYEAVKDSDYPGSLAGSIDPSMPTSFIDLTSTDPNAVKTAYMYERTVPNTQQPATCILVAGYYTGANPVQDENGVTWFKFEITDQDGGYFPIYRGLSYDIKIGLISGSSGYDSAEAAAASDAIGDISGSPTTATLEQISDGKGTTLWVSYIDYVATEGGPVDIYYTMYYKEGNDIEYLTATPSVSHKNLDINYRAIENDDVTVADGTFTTGMPDPSKQWKKATVTLKNPGQNTLRSILHIEGTSHAGKPMYREVNYRVMNTQKFENGTNKLSATPLEDEDAGQETTLTIYLPSDLGYSMFPLDLCIEAENGNFTTVDGLPVESGPSLFNTGTNDRNAFYFLKTINYDDYYDAASGSYTTAFTATFKTTRDGTTTAAGTNATQFAVVDKVKKGRTAPYFEIAKCDVNVGGPAFFLVQKEVEVNADVTSVTMKIRSTTNGTWTLVKGAGVTSVIPDQESYTGSQEITVRIPTNDGAAKEYTVTALLDTDSQALIEGYEDQVFKIKQRAPSAALVPVTRQIATTYTTFNSSYVYAPTSGDDFSNEVSISFTGGQTRAQNYIDLNQRSSSVTISANTITKIVITWYSASYAAVLNQTTITSGGGSIAYSTSGNYPTTTWTKDSGADSVTLSFARNGNTEFTVRRIDVTYLVEQE